MRPQIYKVERIGGGVLAVMAKPASEWLDAELAALAAAGIRTVMSLLETREAYELGLAREADICEGCGVEFIHYPIPDRGVPPGVPSFRAITKRAQERIASGDDLVIHCRAGIGRSGLVAAGVLLHCGYGVQDAFALVSKARRVAVPDTAEQEAWLHEHSRSIVAR
ncbi:protein-tyrosine phosphatase family protein [Solimonas marina]|uniref:Protein tyrosine phosphatase n=1 Tax=Solimonas marina TaxID=2714601 RepID=A0A969W7B3_9GAMM|nr:protein-tyrosine phosphatase family protein [Solimonas marina]NKF21732.1 protein tyrosine phosphatase [Solimonas marina]